MYFLYVYMYMRAALDLRVIMMWKQGRYSEEGECYSTYPSPSQDYEGGKLNPTCLTYLPLNKSVYCVSPIQQTKQHENFIADLLMKHDKTFKCRG